jgi:AcrR family transcriptional regulator
MRNERKNAVRQTIIDTASRLFYKQGYANTGINQILDESGVVKSTLYTAFSGKEDILMEYLIAAGSATDIMLLEVSKKGENPVDRVLSVFDFLLGHVEGNEYYGCNFLNLISELPPEAERVIKQIQKQKNHVRQLFAEILEPIGKENLADELYVVFEGALIANKVHKKRWPVENAKKIATILLSK